MVAPRKERRTKQHSILNMNAVRCQASWGRIKAALEKHPDGLSITQLTGLAFLSRCQVQRYLNYFNQTKATTGHKRQVYIAERRIVGTTITFIWKLGSRHNAPVRPTLTHQERKRQYRKEFRAKLAKDEEAKEAFLIRERARNQIYRMRHWKAKQIHPFMFKPKQEEQMQG